VVNKVRAQRQSVLLSDTGSEAYSQALSLMRLEIRSVMCAPLISGAEDLGLLYLDTKDAQRRFTRDDVNLLNAVAGQIAVVIRNAELARQDGAAVETNMLARLNIVDGIFANQVGVRLQTLSVTVMTAGTQPFTTTDSSALLDELKTYRVATAAQRSAGLSHLMTGRNLDGRTIGIAFIGGLSALVEKGISDPPARLLAAIPAARGGAGPRRGPHPGGHHALPAHGGGGASGVRPAHPARPPGRLGSALLHSGHFHGPGHPGSARRDGAHRHCGGGP
jgi:hypothetical protein